MEYKKLVEKFVSPMEEKLYSPLGDTYYGENHWMKGIYWYYEAEDFIVDVEDFYFLKDYINNEKSSNAYTMPMVRMVSNYYFQSDGESNYPHYQKMKDNTLFVCDPRYKPIHYIIHGESKMLLVGMKYKASFFEKYYPDEDKIDILFLETREATTRSIRKIAEEILACKMDGPAAELFFEAKAKEWFSIILNAYHDKKNTPPLPESDQMAIENVKKYIDDHFNLKIPQSTLEQIAFMGGTKLKTTFKRHTGMTITEYTQRKRMDIADNILRTTDMKIGDIAKAVGYSSPARFSALYLRYRGKYPSDNRK
ncbi:MAG: AraC family transcriptional regulator [Tissierellia bacterium]|nr:AraC family transcriptional regulator [Tissierellia bacterium]